jgi:GTP pyrophosphokinase
VTGVNTQTVRGTASMTFTLEVSDAARLAPVLESVARVAGVRWARRR